MSETFARYMWYMYSMVVQVNNKQTKNILQYYDFFMVFTAETNK